MIIDKSLTLFACGPVAAEADPMRSNQENHWLLWCTRAADRFKNIRKIQGCILSSGDVGFSNLNPQGYGEHNDHVQSYTRAVETAKRKFR